MDFYEKLTRKTHPKDKANIFSNVLFIYTLSMFRKGWQKKLVMEDMFDVPVNYESKTLGDKFQKNCKNQTDTKKVSIRRMLFTGYGYYYIFLGSLKLIASTIILIFQPHAVERIVYYFSSSQKDMSLEEAFYYGAGLVVLNLLTSVFMHNYTLMIAGLGIKIRASVGSLILRKLLRLSDSKKVSLGEALTLITKDIYTIQAFVEYGNDIWIGFGSMTVVIVLLYTRIGIPSLVTVGAVFIFLLFQTFGAVKIASYKKEMCRKADTRYQILQESLSAIRTLKMYTWELFFEDRISAARKKESKMSQTLLIARFMILVLTLFIWNLDLLATILIYKKFRYKMTAEAVYFIVTCLRLLTYKVTPGFVNGLSIGAELVPCLKRIQNFLQAPEQCNIEPRNLSTIPKIEFDNVDVTFKDKHVLRNSTIKLDQGLHVLTGPVNSGKSALLKLILGEYQQARGKVHVEGCISYGPQEPWLFPSTIRQNILFGEKYEPQRYKLVIKVCALLHDFERFEDGDLTIVEDEGINFSKGQKIRISLARSVYRDTDIYLLDNCLSGLDAQVGRFVFHECLQTFLQDKLVVLVTDNPIYIKNSKRIINIRNHSLVVNFRESEGAVYHDFKETEIVKPLKEIEEQDDNTSEERPLIETQQKLYNEALESGAVNNRIYYNFIQSGGGYFHFSLLIGVFVLHRIALVFWVKKLSNWITAEQTLLNYTLVNSENTTQIRKLSEDCDAKMNLYIYLLITHIVINMLRVTGLFILTRRAAVVLHKKVLSSILNAPMWFFDTHFIGSILNRFSRDFAIVDEVLPINCFHFINTFSLLSGVLAIVISVNVIFLLPSLIFLILMLILRRYYSQTGRNLARLESIAKSPVVGYMNAAFKGLTTIRAFGTQDIIIKEFDHHQDVYTSVSYTIQCCATAFAFALNLLSHAFIAAVILIFLIIGKDNASNSSVGLALSEIMAISLHLQKMIYNWAELENKMTSVERVQEYTNCEQEKVRSDVELKNWPDSGKITFQHVSLSYGPNTGSTLKDVSFSISSGEKVGIVGRTGAGKTSIVSSIFRLYDVEGQITIDGVDIKSLSPKFLRSRISIIPQDTLVFTGTIRENIDPFNQHTDEEIWDAIESAKLRDSVSSLDSMINSRDCHFSAGEKQLICLVRAILSGNKIVVLDEASANLDSECDLLIQSIVQRHFARSTVFIITHKLQTILDCDKLLVVDKGEIAECGKPKDLLQDRTSFFYQMVKCTHIATDHF